MSNAGKSASCAPSAMFSKSRNTAIVASESCTLISYDVSDIALARQRKLSQQLPWRLFLGRAAVSDPPSGLQLILRSPRRQPLQLIRGEQEPFNRLAANESIHNLLDVGDRDAPVKKVIGLDQNRHARRALIETARCAHARLQLCESARGDLPFQRSIHFCRVLGRAASFRFLLGPTSDADKEIAIALQRGESRMQRAGRQKPKIRSRSEANAILPLTERI